MHPRRWTLGLATAVLAIAPALSAAPRDPEARRKAYEQGVADIDAKDWQAARIEFLSLWQEAPTYDVALGLGQAELNLAQYAQAAEHLRFALEHLPPREKTSLRERTEQFYAYAQKKVARVTVAVTPDGASVKVDGQLAGKAPLAEELFLEPGAHWIAAESGPDHTETKITVAGGDVTRVELSLPAPVPATVEPSPASTPAAAVPVAPVPSPEPRGHRKSLIPVYVAGGVAVVGLSLGIGWTVASGGHGDTIARLRGSVGENGCAGGGTNPACGDLLEQLQQRDHERNASYVSFAVAGAAVLGGVTYLVWPTRRRQTAVSVGWLPQGGPLVTVSGEL